MKKPILLLSALLTLPLVGQEPRPPRLRVVPPPSPIQHDSRPQTDQLQKNTTVRIQGTTTTGQDIDLSLTGLGPRFNADQMIAGNDSVMTCDYLVSESDQGFVVSYTLRIRVKISINPGPPNVEYRDLSLSGNILCKPGQPATIVKNGDKTLQLTVTQEAETPKK